MAVLYNNAIPVFVDIDPVTHNVNPDSIEGIAGEKEPTLNMREALRMTLPGIYALQSARSGGELTKIRYPWG